MTAHLSPAPAPHGAVLLAHPVSARLLHTPTACALACALLAAGPAWADDADPADAARALRPVVVTAVHEHSPAQIVADPKQPRQPMPASDAADYLKTIPGFSAIRSGGSNSDPVLRGQFGSRLPLLTNGAQLLGACPARMDSPSSYISPETFDALIVTKGPQTVLWGPGASAGVVRFERERPDFTEPGVRFAASALAASAGRNDQTADFTAGNAQVYVRATANRSHGHDYRDGDGRRVPSAWDKWNTDVALGWTPGADTLLELSAGAGDGEARYGGRGMDGTQFRRDTWGLRLEQRNLAPWLSKLEAQVQRNRADHVMDNFTLRRFSPGGGMSMPMASNVLRETTSARVAATLQWQPDWQVVAGLDALHSPHAQRSGTPTRPYGDQPWRRDARFENLGVFAEGTWQARPDTRWVGGLRLDRAQAWRYPASEGGMGGMGGMGGAAMSAPADDHRLHRALPSGFVRWERTLDAGASVHAGLGHVQRFPDYWELISPGNSAAGSGNAFATLRPEKTTQLDVGARWQDTQWQLWSSAYVGVVRDYILFDYAAMRSAVRNIDARMAGVELGASRRLGPQWTAQGTLAYAWGRNASDGRPLPQMPPLEARLGLEWAQGAWSAGGLWRLVAAQRRIAPGQGNVVGRDLGASGGFGVLSLHAGWRANGQLQLAAGVDNLLDKTYAEHLNLAGNAGFGYPGGTRLNEPGRTLWLRADVRF
ncbi:TonB-dependent copper receptor [Pulveribacter sp.]|uniref:TonB-dependent copper receptor n=1 Tax=Pulveribacter sp. TaxID=2678893 RepID=UPI0028AAC0E7|nr:TonB-dependent copper receptor [Pulveribacter sp.]